LKPDTNNTITTIHTILNILIFFHFKLQKAPSPTQHKEREHLSRPQQQEAQLPPMKQVQKPIQPKLQHVKQRIQVLPVQQVLRSMPPEEQVDISLFL
jgi:hypothetical protein